MACLRVVLGKRGLEALGVIGLFKSKFVLAVLTKICLDDFLFLREVNGRRSPSWHWGLAQFVNKALGLIFLIRVAAQAASIVDSCIMIGRYCPTLPMGRGSFFHASTSEDGLCLVDLLER
jgi:hypothetical protein